jgi:outer membrane protein TolC
VLRVVSVSVFGVSAIVQAQAAPDTLRLERLYPLAEAADARSPQAALLRQQTQARREIIRTERLPAVNGTAVAQYLSDVASLGALPGLGAAGPLQHQYDANVSVRQSLIDPTRKSRDRIEAARLAESEQALTASLYTQRQQVNDAFFAALERGVQRQLLAASVRELQERQRLAALRVTNGAALQSELLALEAELVKRQQAIAETATEERVARTQLALLIGRPVSDSAVLQHSDTRPVLPALTEARPEFAQFAASRAVLAQRATLVDASLRPRVALVSRVGYGRPGLNALGREFDTYYSIGVQLDWSPWNWGGAQREREALAIAGEMVASNERAFRQSLARAAEGDASRVATLTALLRDDDRIVDLRAQLLHEARTRFDEGELTAAEFVTRSIDLLSAQLDRDTRRVRRAAVVARYLTTIGGTPTP